MKIPDLARRILLGALILGWGVWMFFQLDHFNLPTLDSLFYFAPAAFAPAPFQLSTPLLGGFEGADHSWGANWPGGLLLFSGILPLLPHDAHLYVVLFLGLWLLVSVLTARWVRVATGKPVWGLAAFLLCLFNREFFEMANMKRHEFFAVLALLGAVYGVLRLSRNPSRGAWAILVLSFFLLPLLHPVTIMVGGLFLAALAGFALWDRKGMPLYLLPAGGAYLVGLGALAFYFYRDPVAQALFRDNAGENARLVYDPAYAGGHFFFGRMFVYRLLRLRYLPSNVLHIGALVALAAMLAPLIRSLRRREVRFESSHPALAAFLCVTVLASTQFFSNHLYPVLAVPFSAMLVCIALDRLEGKRAGLQAILVLGFLVGLPLAYFAGKTWIVSRGGWPNYRGELIALKEGLPPARRVLIPYVMWETTLHDSQGVAMNTLPNPNARKDRYEADIYGRMQPGDLVLLDACGPGHPFQSIGEPGWEQLGEKKHLWHSSEGMQGFDITIWRKR